MDRTRLAAGAEGDSVTADRLTDAVLAALDDEQPHHLLEGQSLDVSGGGETERLFPSVDASVWLVATDERVLFVVPQAVASHTERLTYEVVDAVEVETGDFPEFRVERGESGEDDADAVVLNARKGEPLDAAAAFVRDRSRPAGRTDAPAAGSSPFSNAGDQGTGDRLADGPPAPSEADVTPSTARSEPGPDPGSSSPAADSRKGQSDPGEDPLDTLERLADLHDRGVITEAELEARKQELLDQL